MGDVVHHLGRAVEMAHGLHRIQHFGDCIIAGAMDFQSHAKLFGLVDVLDEIGIGDERFAAIATRMHAIIQIGIMEGAGARAGHTIKEYLGEIRPDMPGAVFIAQRKQLIAGKAKHEGWLDQGQGGDGPGRQLALVVQPRQRLHDREDGGGILKGGDAIGIDDFHRAGNGCLAHCLGEVIGGNTLDNTGSRFHQKPGQAARCGIAPEGTGRRVRLVVGNAAHLQCHAVDPAIVHGFIPQQDRMAMAGRIELGKRGLAVERGYHIRAPLVGDNPLAGHCCLGLTAHMGADIIDAGACGQLRFKKIGLTAHHDVIVHIHETRHGHAPAKVHHFRFTGSIGFYFGYAADRQNAPAANGDGLRPGACSIDSINAAIGEDEICVRRAGHVYRSLMVHYLNPLFVC